MPIGSHAKVTENKGPLKCLLLKRPTKMFANWVCCISFSHCFIPGHRKKGVYKTFSWEQRICSICKLLLPGAEIQTQYSKCPCFVFGFLCGNGNIIPYKCSSGCSSMTIRDKPCHCQRRGPVFPSAPCCLPASLFPAVISHPSFMEALLTP